MAIDKYLDPKNDFAFKRIFGSEKNKDILIALLNDVLGNQIKSKVEKVTFLTPIQEPEIHAKKQSIVDVLCLDARGNQYIIEMQVAITGGFEERAQYYAAKAFVSQMDRGGKYESLKEVIFLAFTNFSIFPEKANYKSEHIILDKKTYENNLDKLSFTFVDLPKFDQQRKGLEELNREERFYYFLYHAPETKPKELEAIIRNHPVIERAYKELDRYYWTEEELRTYEDGEKGLRDYLSSLQFAQQEGIKLGEERGIKLGEERGIKRGERKALEKLVKQGLITQEVADRMLSED